MIWQLLRCLAIANPLAVEYAEVGQKDGELS